MTGYVKLQIAAVGLLLAASALAWALLPRGGGGAVIAVISLGSRDIIRLELSDTEDCFISLEEEYGVPVSFEVKDKKIRFVNVTCPDHICEKTGYISKNRQTAVCLPNKVSLRILT